MASNERFSSVSEDDRNILQEKARNENTTNSTNTWINTYNSWADWRGKKNNIECCMASEMDEILSLFDFFSHLPWYNSLFLAYVISDFQSPSP